MPQNLFDLPEYGLEPKMYEYKQKILTNTGWYFLE